MVTARIQPSSRSLIGPTGRMHTGRMNSIRVARWPAATTSLSRPSTLTTAPTTKLSSTATQGCGAARLPSVIRTKPLMARPT